jgi:hypothetical protein
MSCNRIIILTLNEVKWKDLCISAKHLAAIPLNTLEGYECPAKK